MPIACLSSGDFDPTFTDAIFIDIRFIDAIKAHAYVVLEYFGIIVRAIGVGGQAVWQRIGHGSAVRYEDENQIGT